MAQNRRVYYACQSAGIAPFEDPNSYSAVRGLQSVGVNTTFNLEQVFEIGQLAIYENIENLPDVEVTMEKVLDGYCPIYLLATEGAVAATLVGRSNQRANVALSIHSDTNQTASGNQLSQCVMSGVFISQVSYDIQVEGNARESVTLVGNNKVWATGSYVYEGFTDGHGVTSYDPAAPEGVNRRQNVLMASCLWPKDISGISSSGTNDEVAGSGMFSAAIQSVRVSTNLGREQMLELGRRGPYFRYVNFPVEVTTAIEIIAKDGDLVSATEDGIYDYGRNVEDQAIHVEMEEGLVLDMGTKNKLNSVNFGGANAQRGGGNATITYSYVNFNDMTVQHANDVTVGLQP
jgi:hypothetical protein